MFTGILQIIDVAVVTSLVYAMMMLLRRMHSIYLMRGIVGITLLYIAAIYYDLRLTVFIFRSFFSVFLILLIVLFQREIRRFLEEFSLSLSQMIKPTVHPTENIAIEAISDSVIRLAREKTGALIVLPGKEPVDRYISGGAYLGGEVSSELLLSIFDASSPGHDGAVIIDQNIVRKFSVHLPLSDRQETTLLYGTRHRAAVGLTELTDALVILVSEERGHIGFAQQGHFSVVDSGQLFNQLQQFYQTDDLKKEKKVRDFFFENTYQKIIALLVSILLWFFIHR